MARRPVSQSEMKLWRKVAKSVSPLKKGPKTADKPDVEDFGRLLARGSSAASHRDTPPLHETPRAKATRLQRKLNDRTEERAPTSPVLNRGNDRKVRRGQTSVDARIDLHGFTQQAARSALSAFLMHHRSDGARCVLVITGKGRMGEGVIRRRLLDWLHEPDIRVHVSSYSQSHQKHGGAGAYYLFLRRYGIDH